MPGMAIILAVGSTHISTVSIIPAHFCNPFASVVYGVIIYNTLCAVSL